MTKVWDIPYPIYDPNAENHTLWGRTYTYIAHIREYPSPRVNIIEEILTRKSYSYFNNKNNGVNNNKRGTRCQNQCFSGSNNTHEKITVQKV